MPESGAGPKTRFKGLFGDNRDRERGLVRGLDLVERTESLMFGLNGVPVGIWGAEKEVGEGDPAGIAGVAGAGGGADPGGSIWGVGDGVGDCRKAAEEPEVEVGIPDNRNLEGERERDLRSDLTAEPTSTWWPWVGEGSVSVPPLPFENDIAACFSVAGSRETNLRDRIWSSSKAGQPRRSDRSSVALSL